MIVLVSQNGYVKRMELNIPRTVRGSRGVTLNANWFKILNEPEGDNDLIILTNLGGIARISLKAIRPSSGVSQGVKAITLQDYENVLDAIIIKGDGQ